MTKPKNTAVLTCDICDFKVTNSYIFKRHMHRCLSLHGIASKRSSPRNPIRLKGTEGLLSKEASFDSNPDVSQGAGEDAEDVTADAGNASVSGSEDMSNVDAETPQTALKNSQDDTTTAEETTTEDASNSMQSSVRETQNSDQSAIAETTLPGAPYSRQYSCSQCLYQGTSARDFLYHLRDEHCHKFRIYECKICNYATRYGNKVERHMAVHNKLVINMDDRGRRERAMRLAANKGPIDEAAGDSGNPKVQPLKLKRLNIRMPFKVSATTKLNSDNHATAGKRSTRAFNMTSSTNSSEQDSKIHPAREVYRMVLTEDGSHHYQCRDCLYYATIPSNVKKHHALCHTRLLCCPHCSLTTMSQGIYYEHLITHTGFDYVKCPDCSYVTSAKSNFEKHRSFHTGGFPFQCTVCNFGAETESKIKRHVATQHTPASDPNGEELNLTNEEDMSVEMDKSEGKETAYGDVQEDITEVQSDQAADSLKKTNTGDEYRCPKCPMVCFRRGNFTRHLMAKHNFSATSAAAMSKSMETQIVRGLKRKKQNIGSGGVKRLRLVVSENRKCSHCSYIAKWPSDLRRHMQVHTIVKRFKCSMCTNKYKYLGDLNVHMRRDHNMEPPDNVTREMTIMDAVKKASPAVFRCPSCPFTTHFKAQLDQHTGTHGNVDKTYVCRLCAYQTYWRGDVGRHLYRHHQIVLSKEASEIGDYFLHRPDIKPTAKQGAPSRNGSLSPDPSTAAEARREASPSNSISGSSSGRKNSTSSSVNLKDANFVCEYPDCEFRTTISDRMESHIAVHLNLKQFMCPTCGKRTNWKWDVVKHMNKVHQNAHAAVEDVITLTVDEAKASINEYLLNFEKKSKELTISHCSLCNFKSVERNRVVRHMGSVHKNENGRVISKTMAASQEFEKSIEKKMRQSSESDQHDQGGIEDSPVLKFIDPPAEELAKLDKPYACAICKKPGTSKGDVKKHYNYTHPYKEVRIVYVGDGTEFNYYSGEIYQKPEAGESPDSKSNMNPFSSTAKLQRMDSKFSNPKMHGYVKPFKCSNCGLRSNWKWDLKKHLRSKHPNRGGFVIMLSLEEASESYGRECTPSHPKNEDFLGVPKSSPSPVPKSSPSPVPSNSAPPLMFKHPSTVKAEVLDNSSRDSFSSSSFFPKSPASSISPSPTLRGRDRSTFFDPNRRQWKCSGCNYISNWRRNMARHIHRKHPGHEGKVKVIPLHLEGPNSVHKQKLMDTFLTSDESPIDMEDSRDVPIDSEMQERKSTLPGDMRLWTCPECSWSSHLRTHIILHMQQHEMKPFTCGVCNLPFKNRGPLHRHLQKIHKRSDYIKLCKVNIKYDDEDNRHNDMSRAEYVNSYFCRLCNLESEQREEIIIHLVEAHNTSDCDNNILKIQKHAGNSFKTKTLAAGFAKTDAQKLNRKFHFCSICPYRSQKKSMLAFHMTYHKPSAANRFKCKYCPYYVSTIRLLHQHQRKWHQETGGKLSREQENQITPPTTPAKLYRSPSSPASTPRRHCCEKCPYTTNSKNDFIYHKQFHRPKRTAEFKCEYCDYWVVHKRLLKQHMRLHTKTDSPGSLADSSPAKSLYSDPGLVYDPVELAELAAIKQKMISTKITASLSKSPNISPMKLASQCAVDDRPNFVMKNGLYRKLHKCRFCPYTNIRARNMQLHELMHGPRESPHPLMKCPYCDYYVGSKGLLSHHMKVHQKNYGDTPENDADGDEVLIEDNDQDSDEDILPQQKVDTLLQISRFKRFGCEKCPYASAKRQHFERHLELHGSRQRYTCQYCDYSVPSNNLLLQHTKLHMMPNQNLLASQSITNLQHLSEVPADVALASALPPADPETTVTISVIHDHLGLYENSIYDPEPKKLYRCDRCPYANVRRDYLLSHLKFHMVPSALACPYCDYSAPKQSLLTQHIRVHFCPLPELSGWLLENGQTERETSQRNIDLAEALKVAHEYQKNLFKKKDKNKTSAVGTDKAGGKEEKNEGKENKQKTQDDVPLTYICQYCDREFQASDKLVKHELQHLIGNHFEASMQVLSTEQQQKQQQRLQQQRQPLQHNQPKSNNRSEVKKDLDKCIVAEMGSESQTKPVAEKEESTEDKMETSDSPAVSVTTESISETVEKMIEEEGKDDNIKDDLTETVASDKIDVSSDGGDETVVENDKAEVDETELVDLTSSPESVQNYEDNDTEPVAGSETMEAVVESLNEATEKAEDNVSMGAENSSENGNDSEVVEERTNGEGKCVEKIQSANGSESDMADGSNDIECDKTSHVSNGKEDDNEQDIKKKDDDVGGAADMKSAESGNNNQDNQDEVENESVSKVEENEIADKIEENGNAEKIEKGENAEKIEANENAEKIEANENAKKIDANENAEKIEVNENAEKIEANENAEKIEANEDPEKIEENENAEKIEANEDPEKIEENENAEKINENANRTENNENAEEIEEGENAQSKGETAEKIEETENADKIEEKAEKIQENKNVEKIEEKKIADKVGEKEDAGKLEEDENAAEIEEKENAEKIEEDENAEKIEEKEIADKVLEEENIGKIEEDENVEKIDEKGNAEKIDEDESADKVEEMSVDEEENKSPLAGNPPEASAVLAESDEPDKEMEQGDDESSDNTSDDVKLLEEDDSTTMDEEIEAATKDDDLDDDELLADDKNAEGKGAHEGNTETESQAMEVDETG